MKNCIQQKIIWGAPKRSCTVQCLGMENEKTLLKFANDTLGGTANVLKDRIRIQIDHDKI